MTKIRFGMGVQIQAQVTPGTKKQLEKISKKKGYASIGMLLRVIVSEYLEAYNRAWGNT